MSEYYADKNKRQELSDLSEIVFGTRSKWQYFVKDRGFTIEQIETQMTTLSVQIKKQEELDGKKTVRKNMGNRPGRKEIRKFKRQLAKAQRSQVRQQQGSNVPSAARSTRGNREGS